jgi:hypothetical protein
VNEKPDMFQPGHSVAPSIGAAGTAGAYSAYGNSPSDDLAAARQRAPLQERPKYVYGQEPNSSDDDISGAYSAEPKVQTAYNPEAYAGYAQYQAQGGYQDAQREYQGQQGQYDHTDYHAYSQYQGYDQSQYGNYDQTGQAYPQQNQYNQPQTQPQNQNQYQAPHPYSSASPAASGARAHDDAYGGM